MNAEFRRVKEIFLAAVEIPDAAERDAYAREACGQDEELRRQVDALLGKHAQAGSFLESPALGPVATADEAGREQSGTVIGPYKLIEEIGEGGMGTVWMAQQTEPVKRLVAVKLIKAGMDSRQVIARFEAERQALALMDHANIARVLEAGTTGTGRPYFVMDLVKGVPITRYCDEHHLTPRQRLELFIPVCQAIQHAHQKGIIHRDLKPSNVLVALYDGKPVPKVIDFGVAKAAGQQLTDKTLVTGFGALVGTLEYMSPEQAEINQLDIDTRSDIYSLGVLLYELLTGSTPFTKKGLEKAGMLEMLRLIREQEPSKPSTKLSTAEGLPTLAANRGTEPAKLTKLVRGELDWIVMKALEKDRSRRYETANGFAMDVQRYLADEAVQACPPSSGYRLRKFVRRNKRPVLAASLLVVVLVAGIIGTTWGMFRATFAEGEAVREAGEKTVALGEKETALGTAKANEIQAKAAQKDAQENLKDALAAVDQMLTRVAEDKLAHVPQMEPIRRDLLLDALKFYQKFLAKQSDDPVIRRETVHAYRRVAGIHRQLGQYDESTKSYQKALELLEELRTQSPGDPELRCQLVTLHLSAATPLIDTGKHGKAASHLKQALQIAEELARDYPKRRDYVVQLVVTANESMRYDTPEEAERILRRNLDLEKLAPDPDLRAQTYSLLARVLAVQRRFTEAEKTFQESLDLRPDSAWTWKTLADMLAGEGRGPEAEKMYQRAVSLLNKPATDNPAGPHWRGMLADTHLTHAGLLKKLNRVAEAEKAYRLALDLYQKLADDFPTNTGYWETAASQRLQLAQFLVAGGRVQEALQLYGEAAARLEKESADLPTRLRHWQGLARAQIDLGVLLAAAGKNPEAEVAFREALAIRDRLEKEFADKADLRRELAASHVDMGHALKQALRINEAIKSFRMALSHAQKWVGAEPQARDARAVLANVHRQLAIMFRWGTGETLAAVEESQKAAREALALYDELAAEFPKEFELAQAAAECVFLLATVEFRREQYPTAEDLCRQAIARYLKLLGSPDHPRTDLGLAYAEARDAETQLILARTLGYLGRSKEAAESFESAVSLMKKASQNPTIAGWFLWPRRHCYVYFGLFLAESGRMDEAEKQFRQVLGVSDTADARNGVAWALVAHPDPRVHNGGASLAVKWAKEAVDLAPKSGGCQNTLGIAQYRAGKWQEAIAALEKSMELRKGGNSFDWFFMAMAHWKLGEKDKARTWNDRALQWMEKNQPQNEELRRFRAEASELLEAKEKK